MLAQRAARGQVQQGKMAVPVAPLERDRAARGPRRAAGKLGLDTVPVVVLDATRFTFPMLVPARRKFANDPTVDQPHGSSTAVTS